jgi:hypothetical protein
MDRFSFNPGTNAAIAVVVFGAMSVVLLLRRRTGTDSR